MIEYIISNDLYPRFEMDGEVIDLIHVYIKGCQLVLLSKTKFSDAKKSSIINFISNNKNLESNSNNINVKVIFENYDNKIIFDKIQEYKTKLKELLDD